MAPRTWQDVGIMLPADAAGPEVLTTCPQCSATRRNKRARCLSANVEKAVWVCHHCGWSGSLVTGERRVEPGWNRPQYRPADPHPILPLTTKALAFFTERGITPDVLERNGVHSCVAYMPQIEREAEAIAYPYRRGGEVVNHKYRGPDKTFRMDTGAERILYKLDDVATDRLVWVEGEMDALACEVAGIRSCVSVPDGAPAENAKDYSAKFTFLDSAESVLADVALHIIAVDNDGPGRRLEDELARRIGREKCARVTWPAGCKDANDVLVQHGADALRACIDAAEPFPIEGVFSIDDQADNIRHLYEHGLEKGVSTGWASMNPIYTVRPGEMTVVTGVPGSGKSNWVDALLVNLASAYGWNFALFSPENQPVADHMARVVEKYVQRPFEPGPTPRMAPDELQVGMDWAQQHFRWILPANEEQWEIGWILRQAKQLVYRHGIRGLVIDPWNELEAQRNRDESETEYVSRVLRVVRQWARQHGVHVWMVVHPTKLRRDDRGNYPVPTLYDAHGSAHWRNKADNGICVWRDLSPNCATPYEVDIHVQKVRFRQIGRIGKTTLKYWAATATYTDLGAGEPDHDERDGDYDEEWG